MCDKTWTEIESDIQKRAIDKDLDFSLSGKWKNYRRIQNNYFVFAVDGTWIRNNLCVYFGHGGHGFVHEFIPLHEIWVATNHPGELNTEFGNCTNRDFAEPCKLNTIGQPLSQNFFDSVTLHEIMECECMKKGMTFAEAHARALQEEIKVGLLKDPYDDR